MHYAVIPEKPADEDLEALSVIICGVMGLPERDTHPSSDDLAAEYVAAAYRAVFNAFGVPTKEKS
jgi:hypothetical protein